MVAALAADTRYCELCREPVPIPDLMPVRRRFLLLHEECASRHDETFHRRRYCELKFADTGALTRFVDNLDQTRLLLESWAR